MSERLEKAKEILISEEMRFVLIGEEEVIKSNENGIKPLLDLIRAGKNVAGFVAADKVVGKAAALLYLKLNIKEIYGRLMSQEAVELFKANCIEYSYTTLVPFIKNRNKTDMCPMDKTVRQINEPDQAFEALSEKVRQLMSQRS